MTYFIKKPDELNLVSVSINGTNLIISETNEDTSFYTLEGSIVALAGNGTNNGNANLLEENEFFIIRENYEMTACNPTPTPFVRGASFGCSSQSCQLITNTTNLIINSLDNITSQNDTTICIDDELVMTATGGTNYLWKELDGVNGNIINGNLSMNASFNTGSLVETTVYRVVVAENNCADSLETTITVLPALNINTDTTICPEAAFDLRATGGSANYIWRLLDGSNGNIINANISTTATYNTGISTTARTYRIIDETCEDSLEVTVSRFVPIPIFAGRDQTICSGMTINLTGQSGFSNYSWQATTGGPILNGRVVAVNPTETTEYELIADDANGCEVRDTVKVIVLEASNFNITIEVPQAGVDKFSVCGLDKTVTVTMENLITDTITNVEVAANLLDGFFYKPGTIVGDATVVNANESIFGVDTIYPNQVITFAFNLGVNCDGIEVANSSGDKNLSLTIGCAGGGASIFTQQSDNFDLAKATLTIPSSTPSSLEMYLNKRDTVTTRVVNGSQGELDSLEFFVKNHAELSLIDILINGTTVPMSRQADGRTYFVLDGTLIAHAMDITGSNNNPETLEFNEFFDIQEIYEMTTCNETPDPVERGINYGCEGVVCEEITRESNVEYGIERPNIVFRSYTGFSTDMNPLCYNDGVIVSGLYFTNNGLSPATQIDFRLDNYSGHGGASTTGFDPNSVTFQLGENGTASPLVSTGIGSNNACAGFPNDLMFNFDDFILNPGDTIFVKFDRYTGCGCNQNTGNSCQIRNINAWRVRGDNTNSPQYQDLCGFNTYNASSYSFIGERIRLSTFLEAPIEINSGESSQNTYNISSYLNSIDEDCASCYIEATYSVGNGLDVTGLMWVDDDGDMWTPDFYDYMDTEGGVDNLTVRWFGTPPGSFRAAGGGSSILLKYTGDCAETGMMCSQGGTPSITQEIRYIMPDCNNCTSQLITCPITNSVEVECPSCDACDGLVHRDMKVERVTFGLGDNDDDGNPEAGEFLDDALIRKDRIIQGDTVKAHYSGYVVGANSYDFAYATIDMAIADYLPLGAEVSIYDADLDVTYTCDVIQQFKDGNNLVNNLSVANLRSLGCSDLPADFQYAADDTISIDFFFQILETVPVGLTSHTLGSRFFVSDEAYGGAIFRCNDLKDVIHQIGLYELFFIQGDFSEGGCSEFRHDWEQRTWLGSSGTAGYDYFPNEYRESWRTPKLFTVTKPELDLISFQIYLRRKNGTQPFNQTVPVNSPYVIINGADYTLNVAQYIDDNGGMPPLDEGARFEIRTRLRGGCSTEVGVYNMPYEIEWDLDPIFFGTTSGTRTGSNNFSYTGGPEIDIQSNQPTVELNGENACFEVRVRNTNDRDADNVFLNFQSNSGAVIVQSIREISNGTFGSFLDPTTDIYELGDLAGNSERRFELCVITNNCSVDSLILNTGWGCDGYPATLAEAECLANDVVKVLPVEAELGMEVIKPSSKVTGDLCADTPYEVQLTSGKLGFLNNINLRFFLPQDVLYVPGSFELAYPVPATGSPTFIPVDDPTNIFGSVFQINISEQNPILSANGLEGTTNTGENFLRVRFMTQTECGYTSGSKVRFLSWAFDACGELTNYRFSPAEAVEIDDVTAPFISDVGAGDFTVNPCSNDPIPLDINLTVGSLSDPIGPNDSLRIMLPIGLEYIPGSYQNVQNSVPEEPLIITENGEQIIYFDLVDGLAPGSRANFTLALNSSIQGQQCADYQMVIQTFSSFQKECVATGEICTVRAASDEFARTVSYEVPILEFTNFEASSVIDGTNETFTVSADIFNNSPISVPNDFETQVDIYADIDNDGKFSPADSLLGSVTTTEGIPALTTQTVSGNFMIPATSFCNLIAVSDNRINCSCPTAYSFPVRAATSFVFDKTDIVCSGDTIMFGPTPIPGYSYEWLSVDGSNITAIEDIDSAQTNFSFVNLSGMNLEWQFALRTIKANDCYSFDTVNITVYPQRDAEIATQGCEGFSTSLSGPTDGSNYQWLPTTGLTNPNSPSSEVSFTGSATYMLTYTDPNGCTAFFEQTVTAGSCASSTTIGDYVWLDENRDGVQDPGEFGIPNVQVFLYKANDLTIPIASTLTGFDGKFVFNPIPAGEYVVGFASPGNNFAPTTINNNPNTDIDSDIDFNTLQTISYLIANGDSLVNIDAGFVEYECTVSVPSAIERICLGTSLPLSASIAGDITTYQWEDAIDLAANPESANTVLSDINSLNPTFTPNQTGVYTFNFIGSNAAGYCSDTTKLTIIVEGEANPVIIGDSEICTGGMTTLVASGGTTYQWFENGIAVGNGNSLDINPTNTSTYRLVATTDFGCTAQIEKNNHCFR